MSFRHYLPFDVSSFQCFLIFDVFSVDLWSHSTFTRRRFFYRRCFLLRHFVGESESRLPAVNIGDGMTILREIIGRTAILHGMCHRGVSSPYCK
jgi:hypothetical protein